MSGQREPIRDVAHLAHVELLTPKPEESLVFFRDLLGMDEVSRDGQSVFLRAWGDQQLYSLKLTESAQPGLGHAALRAYSAEALDRRAADLTNGGFGTGWSEGDYGHGRTFHFRGPDGHPMEIFYEAERYAAPSHLKPALKNQPQKTAAHGASVTALDHINLFSSNVDSESAFLQERLGFRLSEVAVTDEGKQTTAWLHVTNKSYDLAVSLDKTGAKGRFHHLAYKVDSPEMILRAADIFIDNGIFIEAAPAKHVAGQTLFVYVYEPGGNRIEVCAGGFLILSPDWETIVWTQEERKRGLAWTNPLPATFHTYGTPDIK
ncbi:VOC family protein [Cohnella candidum]|uniref:Catechol 2,3-dioxygenase n=1 Tax=Cohnella candidum TaxID=2674991 RepID=A0A3G3JTP2_9BACL|nr:VOC family protein [Cohnella candidum]AYQ71564.1 catechol 2,3-dioxygenase [Cohnella candidum]